jgi:hypothetical protein
MIPRQLSKPEFRFIRIKAKSKKPIDLGWQKDEKAQHKFNSKELEGHFIKGGNYGVVLGCGNLRVIDCDNKTFADEMKKKLNTFIVKTPSGNCHLYLLSDYDKNHVFKNGYGEFRAQRMQVIGAGSYAIDEKKGYEGGYEVLCDRPILELQKEEVLSLIEPFLKPATGTAILEAEVGEDKKFDSRSEEEASLVCQYIKRGLSKKEVFKLMADSPKWKVAHPGYRELTYNKMVAFIQQQAHIETTTPTNEQPTEEELAFLKDPMMFHRICNYVQKKVVGEEESICAVLTFAIGGYASKDCKPTSTNLIVTDESGAGKDFLIGSCMEVMPADVVLKRKRTSPTTLTYWHNTTNDPQWTWDRKIIYLEDINNQILNCEMLKLMMSNSDPIGYCTIVVEHKARDIGVKGKPIVIATTYKGNFDEETTRRVSSIFLDTSKEQTKRIFEKIAKDEKKKDSDCITQRLIQSAIRKLKRVDVVVPFAENLTGFMDDTKVTMRTDFAKMLDIIKFSAAIFQYQRDVDEEGRVIATKEDYEHMKKVIKTTTLSNYGVSITKEQRKVLEIFKDGVTPTDDLNKLNGLKYSQIQSLLPDKSPKGIYKYLNLLTSKGILKATNISDKYGSVFYWKLASNLGFTLPDFDPKWNSESRKPPFSTFALQHSDSPFHPFPKDAMGSNSLRHLGSTIPPSEKGENGEMKEKGEMGENCINILKGDTEMEQQLKLKVELPEVKLPNQEPSFVRKYDKLKQGVYQYLAEHPKNNAVYLDEHYGELVKLMLRNGDIIESPSGTYRKAT